VLPIDRIVPLFADALQMAVMDLPRGAEVTPVRQPVGATKNVFNQTTNSPTTYDQRQMHIKFQTMRSSEDFNIDSRLAWGLAGS
jgi:hypothetical protein